MSKVKWKNNIIEITEVCLKRKDAWGKKQKSLQEDREIDTKNLDPV